MIDVNDLLRRVVELAGSYRALWLQHDPDERRKSPPTHTVIVEARKYLDSLDEQEHNQRLDRIESVVRQLILQLLHIHSSGNIFTQADALLKELKGDST